MKNTGRLMLLGALFLLATQSLPAQDYRAKVQGIVTDTSRAVIVGADVILRNENTGIAVSRKTNETGQYAFDFVEPGFYTVTITMAGFGRFVEEKVQVQVRGDVTVSAVLQPGVVAETINVSDTGTVLEFNTSTMALTIDRKMLNELPIMQRNPFTLALLDPAVVNKYSDVAHRNPFYMWASSQMDLGGNTSSRNDISLDGSPLMLGQKGSYSPPMDAVQEFSVQQNSVDAEFGHSAGGIMSIGMKAGTNEFHGSAYYFGRNPYLNAKTNSVTNTPNLVRNHIWGASGGNPILKNRLFAFTAYEGWRTQDAYSRISTQPTALERTGDFSKSLGAYGAVRTIFDPYSTTLNSTTGAVSRQPFPGNVIPQSRMDSTAVRMMKDIWGPNNPGDDITGVNNFKIGYSWPVRYFNISERMDWNIRNNWKAFVRYSQVRTTLDQSTYVDSPAVPNDNGGAMNNRNVAGDTVYTLNATTVLNFRMSFSSLEDDYSAPNQTVGASGLSAFWPNNAWYQPYLNEPQVFYPALSVGGGSYGRAAIWLQHPHQWSWDATLHKSLGKHSLKAGISMRRQVADGQYPNLMSFAFYQNYTADTYTSPDLKRYGSDWATMLLGSIDGNSYAQIQPEQLFRSNFFGAFVQDDIRLTRRITLNLGLRYEYETAPYDEQDRISRYLDMTNPIPELQNFQMPASVTKYMSSQPSYNGAWVFADSSHRHLYDSQTLTLEPRVGIAIRLNEKTALRGGYARFVIPPLLIQNTLSSGVIPMPGYSASTYAAPALAGIPQSKLSDPFPASYPLTLPLEKSLGRYTNMGDSLWFYKQDQHTGVNDRFNVSVQRQLPAQIHVDFTFFANFGHNLPYTKSVNMMDPQLTYTYKSALDATVANPFYNLLPASKLPGSLRSQATVAISRLLVPYPQYGSISQYNTDAILNRYKSGQLRVQRAFTKGYSFLFAYNYNREKNYEFFNSTDQYAGKFTFEPGTAPRHRASVAGSYEFPFGKGRPFLNHLHPILETVLGGWQTSHLLMANSGANLRFPQAITDGSSPKLDNRSPQMMFDVTKFTKPASYTPRLNPLSYPGVNGNKYWNLDSTLSKTFPIRERYRLEFRFEAYNSLNCFVWSDPSMTVTSSLFGKSTNQANRGREMQYSLRLQF